MTDIRPVGELWVICERFERGRLALRDELQSQPWCVWLIGFEPTTSRVVNRVLYPLSYNHTHREIYACGLIKKLLENNYVNN